MKTVTLLVIGMSMFSVVLQASQQAPYAGQEQRLVKALSSAETEGLLSGKGMGLAKAAELNHYPGPLHVLQIMKDLGLSQQQQLQTQQLYASMKSEAIRIGQLIIEEEQRLDELFASKKVTNKLLKSGLNKIAVLRGELRYVHLKAHLQQTTILSAEQISRYDQLRGYMHHHAH